MNLFLKRLALFLIPLVVFLISIEITIKKIPNSYQLKDNYIHKNAKNIETLILGSSHTFYNVNPIYFNSKTFNYSNVSQSPDMDLAILKSYGDSLLNLKTLVIRLSYDTLFEQLKDSPEDWRLKNYKLYTDVIFDYKFGHSSELISTGTGQVLRTLKKYYFDGIPLLDCDSLGWGNDLQRKEKPNIEDVGAKVAKRHTAKNWDLLNDNVENFNQILDWCSRRDIEVLIITPPSYKSYSGNLDEKQLTKTIEVGKQLADKYKNCTYINFLKSNAFKPYDFFDPDHLNAKGAKKFSIIINDLINN